MPTPKRPHRAASPASSPSRRSTSRAGREERAGEPHAAALRSRRAIWLAAGGLLIVVAAVVVILTTSGSSGKPGAITGTTTGATATSAAPSGPPQGTKLYSETDHQHVEGPVTYDRTPPVGGPHNPVWLNCGVYDQPVPNENAVHSLEHGTVWITYQPSVPASEVATLRQIVESHYVGTQRYLLLSPYPGIPAPVVASAWGAQILLPGASDPRLVQFIRYYAGGGQGSEPGAPCTGGVGTPIG